MVEPRPIDVRDRYLDALTQAQAQGRVAPGEFAPRVDAILNATSQSQLDDALSGLNPLQRPVYGPAPMVPPRVAPPAQPVRPPDFFQRRGWARREAFVVGGSALFLALFGVGVGGLLVRGIPMPYPGTAAATYAPAPAPWASFFQQGALTDYLGNGQYTDGLIGDISVGDNELVVWHQPAQGSWLRTIVHLPNGDFTQVPAEPVPHVSFGMADVSLDIIESSISSAAEQFKLPVTRVQVMRPADAAAGSGVQVTAWVTDNSSIVLDAMTGTLLKVVKG